MAAGSTSYTPTAPSPPDGPPLKPKNEAAARHLALEGAALDLINQSERRLQRSRPSCTPPVQRRAAGVIHDAPEPATLNAIAALRRPARPDETTGAPGERGIGGAKTYVDYIRSVTAANGDRFFILIGRGSPPTFHRSQACRQAQRAILIRLLEGKPVNVRSMALSLFDKLYREQEPAPSQPGPERDGIYLFRRAGKSVSGGGGGGSTARFLTHGSFAWGGNASTSRLDGLVPDGVAAITLEYPRTVSRGQYYEPFSYPSAYQRTVRVQQNVFSVHIPRAGRDAYPPRMVWRDASGKVLRVVRRGD